MRSNPPPKNRQQQRQESVSLQGVPPEEQSPEAQLKARLPKTGYFALADPKAEVYSRAGSSFDPLKRGDRWKSDFIWNEDWQGKLKMEESLQRKYDTAQQARDSQPAPGAAAPRSPTSSSSSSSSSALPTTSLPTVPSASASAFPSAPTPAPVFTSESAAGSISFNRLAQLDDLAADPTPLLQSIKEKEAREREEQEQLRRQLVEETQRRRAEVRSVPLPRGDLRRLDRTNRVARQMTTTVVSSKPDDFEYKAQVLAQEKARYEAEKTGQRLWTAIFSLVGTAATYATYGREVSISYVVGALAGIVYLRLLGKSVDGVGGGQIGGGGAGSVVGQPRLLIPLILALAYNRWNTTLADDYGVHLNFLAILVGFLTYKVAILAKQAKELADEMSIKPQQEQQ